MPVYISVRKPKEERYLTKKEKPGRLQTALGFFSDHVDLLARAGLSFKEFVYVCIIALLFVFLSFIGHVRTEPAAMNGLLVSHYGFPLEWLEVFFFFPSSLVYNVRFIWIYLILDFVLYFLLATAIMYGLTKLKS